jgi:tRNA modification GTPase
MNRETIAATATPPGRGAIGIVRLSGPKAFALARALSGRAPRHRRAQLVVFRDAAGRPIDRGLQLGFRAPRSFTGEDCVEFHAHGAPVVLAMLEERLVELGARRARPGEFSERAFLNGKLDLAQAEALADLIAAGSRAAARAALRSLSGAFSERVRRIGEALLALRVEVEAAIDFPDEGLELSAQASLAQRLAALSTEMSALGGEVERGCRLREGLHVVLLGRPNAGKSSLLNALLGEERAIVTPIAGTTRDLLRESIALDGLALTLVDTAGLRETDEMVEAEGIRRALAEAARADLLLLVLDAAIGETPEALRERLPGEVEAIPVFTKIDLVPGFHPPPGALAVSALTGEGLDALRALLRDRGGALAAEGAFSARPRHLEALRRSRAQLEAALAELVPGREELLAEALRLAQRALGEITGEVTSEELLGRIFSSFCIGK